MKKNYFFQLLLTTLFFTISFSLFASSIYEINGSTEKVEAEGDFVVVTDNGSYAIEADPGFIYNDGTGKAVRLWDSGDKIKINFNANENGKYRLKVRLRSGQSGETEEPERYWPSGYVFTVDGITKTFEGNSESVFEAFTGSFLNSYWGDMNSEELSLTSGSHYLTIEAKEKWAGVDYLEIEEVEDNGEVKITFEDIPDQSNLVGDEVSLQLKASASNGGELVYELLHYNPGNYFAGLDFNRETGLISGTVIKT
ncbi:unnamed protein product, partial [Scytosiphon promiscuus]